MAIPVDGLYIIRTAMNTSYVMDCDGDTSANRANIMIYTKNGGLNGGGNHQRFYKRTMSNGDIRFFVANYGKAVEIYGKTAATGLKTGDNVNQMTNNGSICQQWAMEETTAYNGTKSYFIKSKINQNFVMDVSGARTANGQNIMMHPKWTTTAVDAHGDNQKWIFEKTCRLEPKWAVPANIGICYPTDTSSRTWVALSEGESVNLAACFTCSGGAGDFQIRYRKRTRKLGTDNWTDWSSWQTYSASPSTADEGWGNIWATNTSVNANGTFKKTNNTLSVTVGSDDTAGSYLNSADADRIQYQIEVRRFGNVYFSEAGTNIPSVGNAASATVNVTIRPSLSIDGFAVTNEGLKIGYQGSMHRTSNKLILGVMTGANGKKLTRRSYTFSDINWDGTVTIPLKELCYVPDPNEQISFTTTWTQTDNSNVQNWTRSVAYDAAHGLVIDAVFNTAPGSTILATPVEDYSNPEMHIIFQQDGETINTKCEMVDGKFELIPPLNKDYQVIFSAGTGDNWGVRAWKGIKVEGEGQMFNFNGTYFRLFLQESAYSEQSTSYSANASAYSFMGNRRETVYFGEGGTVDQDVTGLCPIDITQNIPGTVYPDKCSLEDFHALRNAKYAVYRDLYGRRYDIAVMSTTEKPAMDNLFSVSLTLKERMS